MHTGFLSSLAFALLLGITGVVNAAPAATAKPGKLSLNTADAQTIQSELSGICEAKA